MLRAHLEPIYRATYNMGGILGTRRGSTVSGAFMAGDADDFDEETTDGAYQLTATVKALLLNDLTA